MDSVKQKLFDFYAGSWPDKIRQTPKLRTYVTFKSEFKTEEYIKMNLQRNKYSILAQFCCGILPIRTETGRFVGERSVERLCKLCDLNVLEMKDIFCLNVQLIITYASTGALI